MALNWLDLSFEAPIVICRCLFQRTVAAHCVSTVALNGCVNLKCDPVINLHFADRAEHIQFLYYLCKLAFAPQGRYKYDLAVTFCTAP